MPSGGGGGGGGRQKIIPCPGQKSFTSIALVDIRLYFSSGCKRSKNYNSLKVFHVEYHLFRNTTNREFHSLPLKRQH